MLASCAGGSNWPARDVTCMSEALLLDDPPVTLYQDQVRAEHTKRRDTGWETQTVTRPDDLLDLAALGCGVRMGNPYVGMLSAGWLAHPATARVSVRT